MTTKHTIQNMKHKASLNQRGWKTLPNGNSIPLDKTLFYFWFGYIENSLEFLVKSDTIDSLKNTIQLYTRHNDTFTEGLNNEDISITIGKTAYTITMLQPDDSSLNGMDILTLSKVS